MYLHQFHVEFARRGTGYVGGVFWGAKVGEAQAGHFGQGRRGEHLFDDGARRGGHEQREPGAQARQVLDNVVQTLAGA